MKRSNALRILAIAVLVPCALFAADVVDSTSKKGADAPSLSNDAVRPLPFRPGDALQVVTYPDTTAFPSGFYPIDGEGYCDFPIIGYMKVTEKSADDLAKTLSEKYVDFMRFPHIKIRPMIRVALNGGFYRPGLYWINPHATLWEAVQTAGGTQRRDGFEKVKWERDRTVVTEDLVPLLEQGKSLYQLGFKTGDQITVLRQPDKSGWEVFTTDVLPVVTFAITTAVSVLTVYNSIRMYENYSR